MPGQLSEGVPGSYHQREALAAAPQNFHFEPRAGSFKSASNAGSGSTCRGIRGNNAVSVYLRILDVQLQTLPPGSPSLADATYPSNRSGSPGEYIIQNEETGERVVITSNGGGGHVR